MRRNRLLGLFLWAAVVMAAVSGCVFLAHSGDDPDDTVGEQKSPLGAPPGQSISPTGEGRLAAGPFHTCMILGNGALKCWGANAAFQLGIGSSVGGPNRGDEPGEMGNLLPALQLPAGLSVRAVAPGYDHTCALLSDSSVKCWGTNTAGALGIPITSATTIVGDAPGELGSSAAWTAVALGRPARAIAAADGTTCALLDDGTVKCWGDNSVGQLGLGSTIASIGGGVGDVLAPVDFGAPRTAVAISGGLQHFCAILDNGDVKCWGDNSFGQLGNGSPASKGRLAGDMGAALPRVPLPGGHTAVSVAAGADHSCARLDDGTAACWGTNTAGQLGTGDLTLYGTTGGANAVIPLVVLGSGVTVRSIVAGTSHTCAILNDGTLKCWGMNGGANGTLGIGLSVSTQTTGATPPSSLAAVSLGTLRTARAVSAGRSHTCAWLDNGSVKCWGYDAYGQLGIGTTTSHGNVGTMGDGLPPVYLSESLSASSTAYGTCSISGNGSLKCWGYNASGQLGLGDYVTRGTAANQMSSSLLSLNLQGHTALQVATSVGHTCAIYDDHSVRCWGSNGSGELGTDSPTTPLPAPPTGPVALGAQALAIGVGIAHTCALLDGGVVKCWGSNQYGQLGINAVSTDNRGDAASEMENLPAVALLQPAKAISVGEYHTCALLSNSTMKCWGYNVDGELGLGDTTNRSAPAALAINFGGGLTARAIGAGAWYTCAILSDGNVRCWGDGTYGQLGLGTTAKTSSASHASVPLGVEAVSFAAGAGHACALLNDATVKCWGNNGTGQLGLSDTSARGGNALPLGAVPLGTGVAPVSLTAGTGHSCALLSDGRRKCWGDNVVGELGLGDTASRGAITNQMGDALPAIKLGMNSPVVAMASGYSNSCAILESGPVKCWGSNAWGQLGVGDTIDRGSSLAALGDFLPAVQLGSGRSARSLSVGDSHTCALLDNGTVKCWGKNSYGQLGVGDTSPRGVTAAQMNDALSTVPLGRSATAVVTGYGHSCALLDNGSVKCWGRNESGELGLPDESARGDAPGEIGTSLPVVPLGTGRTARAIAAAQGTSCALLDDSSVKCWGSNGRGELGVGNATSFPPGQLQGPVQFGTGTVVSLAPGCALLNSNAAECWGGNAYGQLGLGDTTDRYAPSTAIAFPVGAAAISSGQGSQRCAILEDGTLSCWGRNNFGQLGLGDVVQRTLPVVLPAGSLGTGRTAQGVSIGFSGTCAILDNGAVKCWGFNGASGWLGVGDTASRGSSAGQMGDALPEVAIGGIDPCAGGTCNTSATACATGTVSDDGNRCTIDSCTPGQGVQHVLVTAGLPCLSPDGTVCNGIETCNAIGQCVTTTPPPVQDDGNPCTTDSACDPSAGVTHTNLTGTTCDDGSACTSSDVCTNGVCGGTPVATIDDQKECTTDGCRPVASPAGPAGPYHTNTPIGTPCPVSGGTKICDGFGACASPAASTPSSMPGPTGSALAPGLSNFQDEVSFLYTGTSAQQKMPGGAAVSLDALRVGIVRGRVFDFGNSATGLQNVTVSVLGQPNAGQVVTRTDGGFDIAVNGGGTVTLRFDAGTTYLPSDRQIYVPWHQYAIINDVGLLQPPSPQARTTSSNGVVTGEVTFTTARPVESVAAITAADVTNNAATQPAALLMPSNVAIYSNGQRQYPPTATVGVMEYTVGTNGHAGMPASLPPTTAYTYAVDFQLQETGTSSEVTFNPPLPYYVKSVLSAGGHSPLKPGDAVPAARYDRTKAAWVPGNNGVVVNFVSVDSNGAAVLDSGSVSLGIPAGGDELKRLKEQFAPTAPSGTVGTPAPLPGGSILLWRVLIDHFSPHDFNYPKNPPPCQSGACPGNPPPPPPGPPPPPNPPCGATGSIIECESQILGEKIPLPGSPFTLNYRSNRVPGYKYANTLRIPLAPQSVHPELKAVRYHIDIAGRRFEGSVPGLAVGQTAQDWLSKYGTVVFTWDGNDAYGHQLVGPQSGMVTVEQVYPAYYAIGGAASGTTTSASGTFGQASPNPGVDISADHVRDEFIFTFVNDVTVGAWDARGVGLGGWTLDAQHTLDPESGILYRGDGTQSQSKPMDAVIQTFAGGQNDADLTQVSQLPADGSPALSADFGRISDIAVGPDGQLYVATAPEYPLPQYLAVIFRIDRAGNVYRVAGSGATAGTVWIPDNPANGSATSVALGAPTALAFGPDGNLFYYDQAQARIGKIDLTAQKIVTVAGNGSTCGWGCYTEGADAKSITLVSGDGAALHVLRDGSIIWGNALHFQKIDPAGKISLLGGNGGGGSVGSFNGDCGRAVLAGDVRTQGGLRGIGSGPDGAVYVGNAHNIRRIGTDGVITSVFGTWGLNPPSPAVLSACPQPANGGSPWTGPNMPTGLPAAQSYYTGDNDAIFDLDVTPQGDIVFSDGTYIRKLDTKGIVTNLAGNGATSNVLETQTNIPAVASRIVAGKWVAASPDGSIYFVADWVGGARHVYKIPPVQVQTASTCDRIATSDSGDEIYCFKYDSTGKMLQHVETRLAKAAPASPAIYKFAYDAAGHLQTVTDARNTPPTTTTITVSGNNRTITGPFGQAMMMTLDSANGYPTVIKDTFVAPEARTYNVTHDPATGQLLKYIDPVMSQLSQAAGTHNSVDFTYDALGLLLTDTEPTNDAGRRPQQRLVRAEHPDATTGALNFDVTRWNASGYPYKYSVVNDASGDVIRSLTPPDGLATATRIKTNGHSVTSYPDGTVIDSASVADPLRGQWASYPALVTTTLPAGSLAKTELRTRTATADPTGVLLTQTDTTYVNPTVATQNLTDPTQTDPNGYQLNPADGTYVTPYKTTVVFDNTTRTETTTSPEGRQSIVAYDPAGRIVSRTRSYTTSKWTGGAPAVYLKPTSFAFDPQKGLLTGVTQDVRVQSLAYASSGLAAGYLQTDTRKNGTTAIQTLDYVRDALGRATQTKLNAVATSLLAQTWDGNGLLKTVTPPGKPAHQQDYTLEGLLSVYTPPAVSGISLPPTAYYYNDDRTLQKAVLPTSGAERSLIYGYDPLTAQLKTLTTPEVALQYQYYQGGCTTTGCAPGRLKEIGAGTQLLDFTYNGRLDLGMSWSGSPVVGSVGWTYDSLLRPMTETVQGATGSGFVAQLGYDKDGLLTCGSITGCPSGTNHLQITRDAYGAITGTSMGTLLADAYTYTPFGEVASYSATDNGAVIYSENLNSPVRDALGRIMHKTEAIAGVAAGVPTAAVTTNYDYGYDTQNRLSQVTKNGVIVATYGYDANGNRTSLTTVGPPSIGVVDAQDRLTSYGTLEYTYTDNGELLTKTDTETGSLTQYAYDARGNLIMVTLPSGVTIRYTIDGKNRRVAKTKCPTPAPCSTVVAQWLYHDDLRIAAELNGSGQVVSRFVYATDRHTPDFMVGPDGTTLYRIVSDHLGSPRYIAAVSSGTTPQVPFVASYDVFGAPDAGSVGVGLLGTTQFIPTGFAGGQYDADTGLIRFGARDYDATTGRWMSKDPIRFGGVQANLYVYAGNDPMNKVDPSGRDPSFLAVGGTAAAAAGAILVGAAAAPTLGPILLVCGSAAIIYDYFRDNSDGVNAIDNSAGKLQSVTNSNQSQEDQLNQTGAYSR